MLGRTWVLHPTTFGPSLCLEHLKYCNMSHSSSEIKLLCLPWLIIGNNHYCGQYDKGPWPPLSTTSTDSMCRSPQAAFYMILASRRNISAVVRSTCCTFVPKTSLTLIPYTILFEILTKKYATLLPQSLFYHWRILTSTKMVASLLQILVLFLNIASNNHFSVSSNRYFPH